MALFPVGTYYFNQEPSSRGGSYINAGNHIGSILQTDRMLLLERLNGCTTIVWDYPERESIHSFLSDSLGVPLRREGVLKISHNIYLQDEDAGVEEGLKSWLLSNVPSNGLIMTHPYPDPGMLGLWAYPYEVAINLADKGLMGNYVPEEFLAHSRLVTAASAASAIVSSPVPFVAKAPLSSAGDGVRVCLTSESRRQAASFFAQLSTPVVIQEYIPHVNNVTVYFEVPYGGEAPRVTGFTEQVVTQDGSLVGALVQSGLDDALKAQITSILTESILPKVKALGWFGLGGIDCLVSNDGRLVFMDPNFRANTSVAVVELQARGLIEGPVWRFRAVGDGISRSEVLQMLERWAKMGRSDRVLTVLGMAVQDARFVMDACLGIQEKDRMLEVIRKMESMGLSSPMFDHAKGAALTGTRA